MLVVTCAAVSDVVAVAAGEDVYVSGAAVDAIVTHRR